MRLVKLNREDLDYVAANMRRQDRAEIFSTRWSEDQEFLCDAIMMGGEFGFIAGTDEGVPVAAFGAIPVWNGVWEVWMFATDDWQKVALGVHRFIKRVMIKALEEAGCHRAQCRALSTYTWSQKWLESLGAYKESELKNYGSKGETFYLYCWTRPVRPPL